jgi:AcrR family transcriptional regulator
VSEATSGAVPATSATTQERILDATLAALARHGTRRLTMTDVINEAGIARGTLYRYFPNKDALLGAVAGYVRDGGATALRSAVEERPALSERFQVVASVLLSIDWMHPESIRILDTEPGIALAFLRADFPKWVDEVSDLLEDAADHLPGVADGQVTVRELADALLRVSVSLWLLPTKEQHRVAEAVAAIGAR